MAFFNMIQELLGIPGCNLGLVKTKINESYATIQNENVWSFQLQTGGWLTPSLLGAPTRTFLSPGTITVTPFTNTITGDAIASAAWLATITNPPLITQYQIRVPYYSLYSIIAMDSTNTSAVVLTIDRPWMEPEILPTPANLTSPRLGLIRTTASAAPRVLLSLSWMV